MSTASCKICGWMGEGHQLEEHQRTHRTEREALDLARAARRCRHGIELSESCFECGRRRSAPFSQ